MQGEYSSCSQIGAIKGKYDQIMLNREKQGEIQIITGKYGQKMVY